MPIDAGGNSPPPVLIATGRVPVFDAAANATSGAITACPWAPGGGMKAGDQARGGGGRGAAEGGQLRRFGLLSSHSGWL